MEMVGKGRELHNVIYESIYWKDPLLSAAKWLRRIQISERTRESTLVRIEKEVFVGFYSIRKLFDTRKISDSTRTMTYELSWFPKLPNARPVDFLNWNQLENLYDMETENKEKRDIRYLCNQFIHSYVFVMCAENRINGFFVVSGHMRNKKVYYVPLSDILHAFRLVGHDYPANLSFVRNSNFDEIRSFAW